MKGPTTPDELRRMAAQWRGVANGAHFNCAEMRDNNLRGAALEMGVTAGAYANACADALEERARHLELEALRASSKGN